MSEKNKSKSSIESKIRRTLPKVAAIGAIGLTALGVVELRNHVPRYDSDNQSQIMKHKLIPEHTEDHGYGKFPIYDKVPTHYDLVVEQHEPGKFGADNEGNVTLDVEVSKDTYDHVEDGQVVDHMPIIREVSGN